ncbi:class I SAM-dependent methyltransferase [Campylobacter gastrosuis]|uniref:Class I SAM-dependent methyltransferase n=1 Tax=Campylobacter gastrosuis TaxID=2974576 RepID=A0ABT7HR32_9BACT|nr:class I SAM-dependent methyltransferase [Campylobacter gastrosuis]MDL0089325.1 class I SAM-dependent methyltransferase [Campylobacter gastrosuis]
MQEVKDYYDKMPYFSAAFADSSPVRLNAIGEFLNLNPPPLKTARILELGSSFGGNILPFAMEYQDARVVGIDISLTQTSLGNKIANDLGLKNFTLLQKDIFKLTDADFKGLGEFDYIIAHGLYSWVSDEVRAGVLAAIRRFLSPNGIAYISYNVYPGYSTFSILREFMLFAGQGKDDRLGVAKGELKFLSDYLKIALQAQQDATLKDTLKLMQTQLNFLQNITKDPKNDYYILHDFLENFNKPTYFYKFVDEIGKYGLCYLLDSDLGDIFSSGLGLFRFDAHIEKYYQKRVQKEQMKDFLLNRSFRKSLVMKKEVLNGSDDFEVNITPSEISRLYVSACLEKKDENFYLNNTLLNPEFNEIFTKFYDNYPQSLSLENFNDKQTAIYALLELISNQNAVISTKELKKVEFISGKTRLKPHVKAYFEYFLNTQNPVILLANHLNKKADFSKNELEVAINFDKINELNELENFIKDEWQIKDRREFVKTLFNKLQSGYFLTNVSC